VHQGGFKSLPSFQNSLTDASYGDSTQLTYAGLVLATYLFRQALGNFRFVVLPHKSERMSEVDRTLSPNSSSYQADQFGALKQNTALGQGGAKLLSG
jgi:hypothetical protein